MRNAFQAMTRAGTPGAERALHRLTARLPVIAASNPALRAEATALFNAINDNVAGPARVAADPGMEVNVTDDGDYSPYKPGNQQQQ